MSPQFESPQPPPPCSRDHSRRLVSTVRRARHKSRALRRRAAIARCRSRLARHRAAAVWPDLPEEALLGLPEAELTPYLHALVLSIELAEEGSVLGGYVCLDAGRAYAEEMAADGLPWAWDLAALYRRAADRYTLLYGERLFG